MSSRRSCAHKVMADPGGVDVVHRKRQLAIGLARRRRVAHVRTLREAQVEQLGEAQRGWPPTRLVDEGTRAVSESSSVSAGGLAVKVEYSALLRLVRLDGVPACAQEAVQVLLRMHQPGRVVGAAGKRLARVAGAEPAVRARPHAAVRLSESDGTEEVRVGSRTTQYVAWRPAGTACRDPQRDTT